VQKALPACFPFPAGLTLPALNLYASMSSRRLEPCITTLNEIVTACERGRGFAGLEVWVPRNSIFFGETCDKPGGFCFSPKNQINSDLLTKSFFRGCQKGTTVKLKLLNHSMAKIHRKGTWGLASKA